jgi:hypothetical protein
MIHVTPKRVIIGDIRDSVRERGGGGSDDHFRSEFVLELPAHGGIVEEDEKDCTPLAQGYLNVVR